MLNFIQFNLSYFLLIVVLIIFYRKVNTKSNKGFNIYFLFYSVVFSFLLVEFCRTWNSPRYLYFIIPLIFLLLISFVDRFVKKKVFIYLFILLLLIVNFIVFGVFKVNYLNYDQPSSPTFTEDRSVVFEFVKDFDQNKRDIPTVVVLEEDWKKYKFDDKKVFDRSYKDITVSKLMPLLVNREKLYMVEKGDLSDIKLDGILSEFGIPNEIYILSKNKILYLDSLYKERKCYFLFHRNICFYKK